MTSTLPATETQEFCFAFSATFTAEPLGRVIDFWGRTLNGHFTAEFGPFNQVVQSLISPASVFGRNGHGLNVVALRVEDLAAFGDPEALRSNLQLYATEFRNAAARCAAPLLCVICPPSPAWAADRRNLQSQTEAERILSAVAEQTPGFHLLCPGDIQRLYPVEQVASPEGERLGRIPYTDEYFAALGTAIVRHAHASVTPPYKVIALDCDNTLWSGICGEDGPEGVVLDEPYRRLQLFMTEQYQSGMLLTLASKNNAEDVWDTFRAHPEMPLGLAHFAAHRLNWEPKEANLADLADQLSLSLDSFVFIDDNPKEYAEVREALPQVLSLVLPEDPGDFKEFLRHIWAFDRVEITEEDRNRNAYYQQEQEFGAELKQASSLKDFLNSLGLQVRLTPVGEETFSRASQLTQRTNQFNLTTERRSVAELRTFLGQTGAHGWTADVSDRFGSYGITGLLLAVAEGESLVVDTFLLSCRVLGRGVEHRVLSEIARVADGLNVASLGLIFKRTNRNKPALEFLESLALGKRQETEDGFELALRPADLIDLKWTPTADAPTENAARPAAIAKRKGTRRDVPYGRIARELRTAAQILAAVRGSAVPDAAVTAGLTETERALASIWAELLQKPAIAAHDNFFDLGGHSLLAVLLLMRIKETFGVELSIDDVYSGSLTLADLAGRIEGARFGGVTAEEYAALLAEIEGMSDEEVRALLEEEGTQRQ